MADPNAKKPAPMSQQRRQELDDVLALMRSPSGRRFVWRLLSLCGVYQTSFTGNSGTFFNEGQRNVGLQVLGDVHETALDEFLVMMKEAKNV